MQIPDELLQRLMFISHEQNYGMLEITNESGSFRLLLFGKQGFTPDQACIVAAHALLEGVIKGDFNQSNEQKLAEAETTRPM